MVSVPVAAGEVPAALVAVTETVYEVEYVRRVSVHVNVGEATVQVSSLGDIVTV